VRFNNRSTCAFFGFGAWQRGGPCGSVPIPLPVIRIAGEVPLSSLYRPNPAPPASRGVPLASPVLAGRSFAGLGEAVLVFVLALLVRLDAATGLPPQADDLYHFYAARSLLADGSFTVLSGTYVRAADFTRLVAAAMGLFGESLEAARLPSLIAGSLLVAAVHLWLRGQAGRGVAAVASALLIVLYPLVLVGALVRFYALQALLFWIGTAVLYHVVVQGRARVRTAVLALLALLFLGAATRLQIVTLIGLIGFATWAAVYLTWRMRNAMPRWALVVGWLALLLGGGALAYAVAQTGFGMSLLRTYRSASLWAEPTRDAWLFYYYLLAQQYGVLGNYLPLAAVAAFLAFPRPALYCAIVLVVGLVLHSFGGMKQDRYIAYLLPYVVALWAMAAWPMLRALGARLSALLAPRWRLAPALATAAVALLTAALAVKEVPELERGVRGIILPPSRPVVQDLGRGWQAARVRLQPLARQAEVFIADDDLQAAFHVARADFFMNRSQLLENDPPTEFVRDFRTGTPMISSVESLRAIFACFDRGLIVSGSLALSWLTPEAREAITAHARPLDLPPPIYGFTWDQRLDVPDANCPALRRSVAETAPERVGP
jgi:4-amino-4-deoxy-L-arabinose transferase-like glycosyltransferase